MTETIFTNATLVLERETLAGTLVVRDGRIAEIETGRSAIPGAVDCDGDMLLPGLVELHTDHLERHVMPRPGVFWPAASAVLAHDAQIASAGITTVFDALSLGDIQDATGRTQNLTAMIEAVTAARADNLLRADHWLHFRCEVSDPGLQDMLDPHLGHPLLRLASVMDHTPGQRQFVSREAAERYYRGKYGMDAEAYRQFCEWREAHQAVHSQPNRTHVVQACQARGVPLASHDDATRAHVDEAFADGIVVAEFPTTEESAAAAHEMGLQVLGGAPNIVRGGSHSGNVAVRQLAQKGWLDILSSDYVPCSLLQGAIALTRGDGAIALPAAIRLVSANPADAVGMTDRGRLATGLRADVVRMKLSGDTPVVRAVWREGARVV
jgi:alpha-D-ribose 1-methylphosphonate 5-triphosphate diphosphatase